MIATDMELELYDGLVKLMYHDGQHKYTVSKKVGDRWGPVIPTTGTTTITSIINKPALMKYPMNKALEYLRGLQQPIKEADFRAAAQAHVEHSNAGKDAGKVGHTIVEALLTEQPYTMPTEPTLRAQAESVMSAFKAFELDYTPETISSELPFYSLLYDYAGTMDYVGVIDGKLTIADFKTTNPSYYNPDGIYVEYFAQLGAYTLGYEEMTGNEVEELMVINLPKDGSQYKVKKLSSMGLTKIDAQLYFLSCLSLYRLHQTFGWKLNN